MRLFYLHILLIIITLSCNPKLEQTPIHLFENELTYISNYETNNSIEGNYIYANSISNDTLSFDKNGASILKLINTNWLIGQGNKKDYSNTGKEALFEIILILNEHQLIIKPLFHSFQLKEPLVFWNRPNKKFNTAKKLINNKDFKGLNSSYGISEIIRNKDSSRWETLIYDCDTNCVQIFGAYSNNLIDWIPSNNGEALLTPNDFKDIKWNEVINNKVTPLIGDIVFAEGIYHIFGYGDDSEGHTYISKISTSNLLKGPFKINELPLIGPTKGVQEESVYFPRIIKCENHWKMYYTGKNNKGNEVICLATSSNLKNWELTGFDLIKRNKGWNSALYNQQVSAIKSKGDTISLLVSGAKQYSYSAKGNVLDPVLGEFVSIDGGITFKESTNNPKFIGDIFDFNQNDHLGGIYQEFETKINSAIIYQAKGSNNKYNCFILQKTIEK